MEIILKGETPSKKNSRTLILRGSKPILLPGKKYREWHENQSYLLKGCQKVENVEKVKITFFPGKRWKSDLTNKAEAVMDLLVDNEIIEDDNWFIIPEITIIFGGIDKLSPRVLIEIMASSSSQKPTKEKAPDPSTNT